MTSIYWPSNIEVIQNRYLLAYNKLIVRAQSRDYQNNNYFEKHHIVPRALGGADTNNNLIYLTAKEHYLAHRFLTRFTTNAHRYKMLYALDAMGMKSRNTLNRYRMPSKVYEFNKIEISKHGHLEETKIKIGLANKGRSPINKGVPRSEETKAKIRQGHLGKKGVPATEKCKETASQYHSNSVWIFKNNGLRKRILTSDLNSYLSNGWTKGRGKCKPPTISNPKIFTDAEKAQRSKFVSQLVWIANPLLQKRLRVPLTQLDTYLNQGWIKGRKFT